MFVENNLRALSGIYCLLRLVILGYSLEPDVVLDGRDASVQCNSVLLKNNLLLNECIGLLLKEVHLVDVAVLQLEEVFL